MEEDELYQTEVYVRILATYEVEAFPGIPHMSSYSFVDTGPDFPISTAIYATFEDFSNVDIDLWHEEVPEPVAVAMTHYGTGVFQ